jgi:hypothetical protein
MSRFWPCTRRRRKDPVLKSLCIFHLIHQLKAIPFVHCLFNTLISGKFDLNFPKVEGVTKTSNAKYCGSLVVEYLTTVASLCNQLEVRVFKLDSWY